MNVTTRVPDERAAVPRMDSPAVAQRRVAMNAPRWIERLRSDRWHVTITVVLDLLAASAAVATAHAWLPSTDDQRYVLVYSWAFVPLVVLVLSTRSLYMRKLDFKFLDDFEQIGRAHV